MEAKKRKKAVKRDVVVQAVTIGAGAGLMGLAGVIGVAIGAVVGVAGGVMVGAGAVGDALKGRAVAAPPEVPITVRRLMNEAEGKQENMRPKTSKECFAMLVAEADREAKRLGQKMELCASKYELLYSRFAKVQQIQDYCAPPNPKKPTQVEPPRQPLEGSAGVLIAQAKELESRLRAEFERLVRAVNENEEKSTLCLANGLLAQAKFGPGKSLARAQHKCDEDLVPVPPNSVLDYCRLTVVFADPRLLARFHDELKQRGRQLPGQTPPTQEDSSDPQSHQSTLKVVRVTNKFNLPKPWKQPPNVHINFEFEGHVCEVQLILEDFLLIKDYSHKPYELVRFAPRDRDTNKLDVDLMTQEKLDKAIDIW